MVNLLRNRQVAIDKYGDATTITVWDPVSASSSTVNEYSFEQIVDGSFLLQKDDTLKILYSLGTFGMAFGLLYFSLYDNIKFIPLVSSCIFFVVSWRIFFDDSTSFVISDGLLKQLHSRLGIGSRPGREISNSECVSIQVIEKLCVGIESKYVNYEINLVMNDGVRLNLVSSPDLSFVRKVSKEIAVLLSIQVWDAVIDQ